MSPVPPMRAVTTVAATGGATSRTPEEDIVRTLPAMLAALDPRIDEDKVIPRSFLAARWAVEYLFRIVGFFVLLCLSVGITLTACVGHPILDAVPIVMAVAFFFYLALTTVGIPVFLAIGAIRRPWMRHVIGAATVLAMAAAVLVSVERSPLLDVLDAYVVRIFPGAAACTDSLLAREAVAGPRAPGGAR